MTYMSEDVLRVPHHLDETHCQDDSCVLASARCSALPRCAFQAVLAAIIVVNLQAIMTQFKDVCVLWKSDRSDLVRIHTHTQTQKNAVT